MRGQAYVFIMAFIGIFVASVLWVVLNHASIEVGDTLYELVDTEEHHNIVRMNQAIYYYSLFFVILFTFLYLLKVTLDKGAEG